MIMVSVYPENVKILCQFIPRTSKTSEITIIIVIIIIIIINIYIFLWLIIIIIIINIKGDRCFIWVFSCMSPSFVISEFI